MEKLNLYFSIDCPENLQEFEWFNLCYNLGRRGREVWRELTKNYLEFKNDDQDKEYVTMKHTEQTKNNQGGSKQKDEDYTDVRMYGIPGSWMVPISSLKLMLSTLHSDCEALFQTPLTVLQCKIIYLNCGETYEDTIDHLSFTQLKQL